MKAMLEGLKTLLDYFRDERHRREDKADEALAAIYAAANETKLYIQKAQRSGKSDRQREEELSRLWTKAAVPIRNFDRDLADRCLMKERWTPSFRPRSAENKIDSRGLLSFVFLFVGCSLCASKPFRKERTSRGWHCPSSLSVFLGFPTLPPQAV